ncbi:hypothetical protein TeGR_g12659 [Tetraparma gracilis]|uniref:Ubiquitin-like domain-containing protein n=1 Tax=Tetraparma gracilis TaxID=2962635 RepID=A0ABQ6N8W1_9STRA|nr:hypothetical protein TeGR_g12659 [Tetraparma gracilis]
MSALALPPPSLPSVCVHHVPAAAAKQDIQLPLPVGDVTVAMLSQAVLEFLKMDPGETVAWVHAPKARPVLPEEVLFPDKGVMYIPVEGGAPEYHGEKNFDRGWDGAQLVVDDDQLFKVDYRNMPRCGDGGRVLKWFEMTEGVTVETKAETKAVAVGSSLGAGRVFVKTLTGRKFAMNVSVDTDSIDSVKAKIQDKVGIPPDQQQLIFEGRPMGDGLLLDNGITYESIIHCVVQLRGGMFHQTSSRAGFLELGGTLPRRTVSVLKGDFNSEDRLEVEICDDETGASLLAKIANPKRETLRKLNEVDAELKKLLEKKRRLEAELE